MSLELRPVQISSRESHDVALARILELQRSGFTRDGSADLGARLRRLDRIIDFLVDQQHDLARTLNEDFGRRPSELTRLGEVLGPIRRVRQLQKRLPRFMKPERRSVGFPYSLTGARAYVYHQPLGVIGIVAPWNAAIATSFIGMAEAFAAGNRVMLKFPEQLPRTSELLERTLGDYFDVREAALITGGPAVSSAFTRLPFDHLLFTGSATAARKVMAAAAENLVPLTLELGGKSPAILGDDAALDNAVPNVIAAALINAGQARSAVDYALVPREHMGRFVELAAQTIRAFYPRLVGNSDYASVIDNAQYARLVGYVTQARAVGCRVVELNPADEALEPIQRVLAPTLIVDPPRTLAVMQEEVFGPILPIIGYRSLGEAIDFVNAGPRPLALYYFGARPGDQQLILEATWSGGVAFNDTLMPLAIDDLPSGGVGASGYGRYAGGLDGVKRFSNPKAVYEQGWFAKWHRVWAPPYGKLIRSLLDFQIKKSDRDARPFA